MSKNKLPIWKRTYELFSEMRDAITTGVIAQLSGKEIQTIDAWCRPPESDEFPSGTGKRNVLDLLNRLIGRTHKENPGLARRIANVPRQYIDDLDSYSGQNCNKSSCVLVSESMKEHSDIVYLYLHNATPDKMQVWKELQETKSALLKVEACIAREIKEEIQIDVFDSEFINA